MSNKLKEIVEKVLSAGYQIEKGTLDLFEKISDEVRVESLLNEILGAADAADPRPIAITRSFVEAIAEKSRTDGPTSTTVGGTRSAPCIAREVGSRLEIMDDPDGLTGCKGDLEDFGGYFRDRFSKLARIMRERLDARDAVPVEDALEARTNTTVKVIAMVMSKAQRGTKLLLKVDDFESIATVLVSRESDKDLFEFAQRVPLDQVVLIEAKRGRGDLLVAQKIWLPDIPERKPKRSTEPVCAVLLSDLHVGSGTFLDRPFSHMLEWLNGRFGAPHLRQLAGAVKYVLIAGDLVDGVGVYPKQEDELKIADIHGQYRAAAELIRQIPDHIEVVIVPGNHDAVRQAMPQPAIPEEFAGPVYKARDVKSLRNPSNLRVHGVDFLVYHGRSLDDTVASVPNLTFRNPDAAMEFLLKCRHLVPEYGKRSCVAPQRQDLMVIERVPDVFQSGHVHVSKFGTYRGTLVVNCGAWQSQTKYQRMMGLDPTPGILSVLNLQTFRMDTLDFATVS